MSKRTNTTDSFCWRLTISLERINAAEAWRKEGAPIPGLSRAEATQCALNIIKHAEFSLPKEAQVYVDWNIDGDLLPPKTMAHIWPAAIKALKAEDASFGQSGDGYLTNAEAERLDERVSAMIAADQSERVAAARANRPRHAAR